MHSTVDGNSRLSFWRRVREFAVPPSVIELATARRTSGDWAGACAAARVDVELRPRSVARTHGRELAAQLRTDLAHLAPDLLRWHLPRVAPDGLLRPGLTIPLARYVAPDGSTPHLVVRTPPSWADAGQRISLALWDPSRCPASGRHPHPRPDRLYRLDLHRHLWDVRRAGELRVRSGAAQPTTTDQPTTTGRSESAGRAASAAQPTTTDQPTTTGRAATPTWPTTAGWPMSPEPADPAATVDPAGLLPDLPGGFDCAVSRWAAEARLLLDAEGADGSTVAVRLGSRHRLLLDLAPQQHGDPGRLRIRAVPARRRGRGLSTRPVLPDAATWVLPDLALLRAGLIRVDQLHPLVAAALVPDPPGHSRCTVPTEPVEDVTVRGASPARDPVPVPARPVPGSPPAGGGDPPERLVRCRGGWHRIGLRDGTLVALDHDPAEIRREELLAALAGTPLPCLDMIDRAHRQPEDLDDIRARLDHGDTDGAVAAVERLLGPEALLRSGALRDELATAALRRVSHGLYRAGLGECLPHPASGLAGRARELSRQAVCSSRTSRARPRHASFR
ncbi:hypothetical protein [Plantactinospora sp. WMMB782]|uniref:hypothetical protein n=1 Tax=Plantactinospora sp. WMMB782 TaxID=3404121 RepID=UPI003B963FDB